MELQTGNEPVVSIRAFAGNARSARETIRTYEQGADVAIWFGRNDVARFVRRLEAAGFQAAHGVGPVEVSGGRCVMLLAHNPVAAPVAYWERPDLSNQWQRACRACGWVEDDWTWEGIDPDRDSTRRYVGDQADAEQEIPWACRKSGCHGEPRWKRRGRAA